MTREPTSGIRVAGAGDSRSASLHVVAHEGRVVVVGIKGAPPLALVDDAWAELLPLPPGLDAVQLVHVA